MATTITPPADFSSVKFPCIFEIDRDTDDVADISINGYLKQMSGAHLQVNAARYFAGDLNPEPVPGNIAVDALYDAESLRRVINAYLSVDGVSSASVSLVCADKPISADRILSDLKRREIAAGQVDEVTVYAGGASELVWPGGRITVPAGLSVAVFRASKQLPSNFTMILRRLADGTVVDSIVYELSGAPGVRLGWVNPYGAIDYFNFPVVIKREAKVTKTKIYTSTGYITTAKQAEDTVTLTTQPLSEDCLEAVSQILCADASWLIDGSGITPVDVVSESSVTYDENNLSALQVGYRTKLRRI